MYLKTKVPAVPWPSTSDGMKEILPTCTSSLFPSERVGVKWISYYNMNSGEQEILCPNTHAPFGVLPAVGLSLLVPFVLMSEESPLWVCGLGAGSADAGGESGNRKQSYIVSTCHLQGTFSASNLVRKLIDLIFIDWQKIGCNAKRKLSHWTGPPGLFWGCRVIKEMDFLSYLPLERFTSVDRVVSEETEGTVCTLVCALVCMLVCMRWRRDSKASSSCLWAFSCSAVRCRNTHTHTKYRTHEKCFGSGVSEVNTGNKLLKKIQLRYLKHYWHKSITLHYIHQIKH